MCGGSGEEGGGRREKGEGREGVDQTKEDKSKTFALTSSVFRIQCDAFLHRSVRFVFQIVPRIENCLCSSHISIEGFSTHSLLFSYSVIQFERQQIFPCTL